MSTVAACFAKSPLEAWIAKRMGASTPSLTRATIEQHQLKALQETVAWTRSHSSFCAHRLASFPVDFPRSLNEVPLLPLTTATDIAENTPGFLCVSQGEISRIVTLQSSGTSGAPKRIFFTAADQELALDFFAHGVAGVASSGDRMLIALPCEREGSVGYQLAKGIARSGVIPIAHGLSADPAETLAHMERERATGIIGLPVQMLALSLNESKVAANVMRGLRSIVLCSDHVPQSLVRTLRKRSNAEIFEHYGMTEMGLGGGVDCEAHMGYHLREADLYFEIVDPLTGEVLPDGELGEVVFTTLNRTGMPLIRYRTGDVSRFLPGPCGCGTMLRRLERVQSRIDSSIRLGTYGCVNIAMLDEALFAVPGLLDFTAKYFYGARPCLEVAFYAPRVAASHSHATLVNALYTLSPIRDAASCGEVELTVVRASAPFPATGAKRKIEVHERG
jgi:phenylacetate-coenzyme A ligase PaaK-like adenylate-forming protein